MPNDKLIAVGTKWKDDKGVTWEVVRVLPFGRYLVANADRTSTAEMNAGMIRQEMEAQKKLK